MWRITEDLPPDSLPGLTSLKLEVTFGQAPIINVMIDACPNLTVLKINSEDECWPKKLFEDAILKCKKLEVFYFTLGRRVKPHTFKPKIYEMSQNLKQLFLPDCSISNYNVRLMIKHIPSLEIVVVHSGMFVSTSVTQTTLNDFLKDSVVFNHFKEKRQGIVETVIF